MQLVRPSLLKLEEGHKVSPFLKKLHLQISDYSFANLFLFRNKYQYRLFEIGEHLFVLGQHRDLGVFGMSLTPIYELEKEILESLSKEVEFLYPLPKEWLEKETKDYGSLFYPVEYSDYLYERSSFCFYQGRQLQPKRNLVNQFLREYKATAVPLIDEKEKKDALRVLEVWKNEHDAKADGGVDDYLSCKEAIELMATHLTDLTGIIWYVEGSPAAFAIGELLRDDTYVVHFAKATLVYKGIYQYLFQQLAMSLPDQVTTLNMEGDLGLESLRKFKLSYRPKQLLEKGRLSLLKHRGTEMQRKMREVLNIDL